MSIHTGRVNECDAINNQRWNLLIHSRSVYVVEELLARREVALVEMTPSGGVLIFVRGQSLCPQAQDYNQSPLGNKLCIDFFGIRSTATVNAIFMSLGDLCARPGFDNQRCQYSSSSE
ncbi:hypothetical protein PHMEG_0005154 [Phytophthora megakarya]|uniref:Uncharacterized protein n=1 Tax=Phytophthora megakarya TaxID=4795 RepID=A0A225WS75_9STRA|nr:hypothetical protein PHMEG_0005154 [Phytophthora megakarya]